ncbi:MAG: amidase family protein [Caldilineaceae bacterium]
MGKSWPPSWRAITLKDSIDTAGIITTGGTVGRKAFVPTADATVAARLRRAGAIVIDAFITGIDTLL